MDELIFRPVSEEGAGASSQGLRILSCEFETQHAGQFEKPLIYRKTVNDPEIFQVPWHQQGLVAPVTG